MDSEDGRGAGTEAMCGDEGGNCMAEGPSSRSFIFSRPAMEMLRSEGEKERQQICMAGGCIIPLANYALELVIVREHRDRSPHSPL